VVPSALGPLELYCDNNGAIAQAKEPRSYQKSKHVLRTYHLIHEIIERGDVKVCKVDTEANTADLLTKSLSQAKHTMHTSGMGIRFMRDWQSNLSHVHVMYSRLLFESCDNYT
jgi:hypothetical protein